MHLKRVIPCLDVRDGRVVKGVNFVDFRDAGDPVELAARYDAEGADELVFLDITASHERRDTSSTWRRAAPSRSSSPSPSGAAFAHEEDVRRVLAAGADKVSMNTAAVEDPGMVRRCAERFGSQCIVVAIDAKRVKRAGRRHARGRSTCTAAARPRASTPSSGRCGPSSWGQGRSC